MTPSRLAAWQMANPQMTPSRMTPRATPRRMTPSRMTPRATPRRMTPQRTTSP